MQSGRPDEAFTPNQIIALCFLIGLSLVGLAIGYNKHNTPTQSESIALQSFKPKTVMQAASPTPSAVPTVSYSSAITSESPSPAAEASPEAVPKTESNKQTQQVAGKAAIQKKIDINAATEADLDTLPGIGPVLSKRIIDMRTKLGKFTSLDQLDDVDGIGPKRLENIRPYLTIGAQ